MEKWFLSHFLVEETVQKSRMTFFQPQRISFEKSRASENVKERIEAPTIESLIKKQQKATFMINLAFTFDRSRITLFLVIISRLNETQGNFETFIESDWLNT